MNIEKLGVLHHLASTTTYYSDSYYGESFHDEKNGTLDYFTSSPIACLSAWYEERTNGPEAT
tara:strand:- start:20 stop:205 length:186 start_codon:yes stop_codon:yes gene_type:complete